MPARRPEPPGALERERAGELREGQHLVAHRPAGFVGERARSERLARNIRRYGESVTDALFAPQRQNAPVLRRKRNHPGRSEEHTSELQSLMRISYAVFCLKKKKN